MLGTKDPWHEGKINIFIKQTFLQDLDFYFWTFFSVNTPTLAQDGSRQIGNGVCKRQIDKGEVEWGLQDR